MAATPQALRATFHRLADRWPVDLLRPNLSFPDLLRRRGDTLLHPPTPIEGEIGRPRYPLGKSDIQDQIQAVMTLLDGKLASERYPITPRLLHPTAMPEYYVKLARELEVAPRRSWLEAFLNSWKGYIRAK